MGDLYHSDLHLPRWKRLALWFLESPVGFALWGIPAVLAAIAPAYWLGVWWLLLIVVAGVSFAFGWNCARRSLKRTGRIDPL